MVKFIIKSILNKVYFSRNNFEENLTFFTKINKNKQFLKKILKKDSTPIFIGDSSIFKDRHDQISKALNKYWGQNNEIGYSFKTNYAVIDNQFFKKNFSAEVVSENELERAIQNKYKRIIFNGPLKTIKGLKKASKHKAIVNIDNSSELENIKKLTLKEKKDISWGIRLKIGKSRFGFSLEKAGEIIKELEENKIKIEGLHTHLGTNILNVKKYGSAAIEIKNFIKQNKLENQLKFIDFGGGFPSNAPQPTNEIQRKTKDISEYIKAISKPLKKIFKKQPKLIIEPGRYIVEDAISLISKVINTEFTQEQQIITCDSTNNILPITFYRPQFVKAYSESLISKKESNLETVIYGSTCQENDLLFKGKLPNLKTGDLLIFYAVGAYNNSIGGNFIFKKPKLVII